MLSQYKLNYEFVDFHTISLKASFISNSSQKENDYEICYWEFRKNYEDWKQLSTSQKDLLEKYDLNNTVEYRFVYRLKNGNDFDISYSNVVSFDGINDLKIKKKNNVTTSVHPFLHHSCCYRLLQSPSSVLTQCQTKEAWGKTGSVWLTAQSYSLLWLGRSWSARAWGSVTKKHSD